MTDMNLQTTIIIPTCNRNELLIEVLPSYLRQKNLAEILIVDDGSSDKVDSYLRQNRIKSDKITCGLGLGFFGRS